MSNSKKPKALSEDEVKVGRLRQFWRNRRHYQLYIFSSSLLALILVFVINLISISVIYDDKVKKSYANTTVFTPSTITSLSGVPINVMLCRINKANNQMFLLLKISNTSSVSFDISSYEILVTNINKDMKRSSKPSENLKGQYYMFGATGYVGIYIYAESGEFTKNYKWITVRSYRPVTNNRTPKIRVVSEDAKYDQYHIFLNPNSDSVRSIDFLETHDLGTPLDSVEIYKQAISENLEAEIKKNISSTLVEFGDVRSHVIEYRRRLSVDYDLAVPPVSSLMAGDTVEDVEVKNSEGNVIGTRRQYNFAAVVPGGINLNWRNLSLRTGYYNSFYESSVYSLNEFISNLRTTKAKPSTVDRTTVPVSEWTFKDGESLNASLENMKPIISEINTYNSYLSKYMSLKTKLQCELFVSLLELELSTNTYMSTARILTDEIAEDGTLIPALRVW